MATDPVVPEEQLPGEEGGGRGGGRRRVIREGQHGWSTLLEED